MHKIQTIYTLAKSHRGISVQIDTSILCFKKYFSFCFFCRKFHESSYSWRKWYAQIDFDMTLQIIEKTLLFVNIVNLRQFKKKLLSNIRIVIG